MEDPPHMKSFKRLMELNKDGVNTPESIRELANCMFLTCKAENVDSSAFVAEIALLTGMACSVLMEYAKFLELR